MARSLRLLSRFLGLLAPHRTHLYLNRMRARSKQDVFCPASVTSNVSLRNRHTGGRCIILGNSPSVSRIDLGSLAGQCVVSVSNGYLHRGFDVFRPRYHLIPQITYGRVTRPDVVNWFREMDSKLGSAELFLSYSEFDLVQEFSLFPDRKVHYVLFHGTFDELSDRQIIDLARPIPGVESVPVMGLMVAMYLGFTDIGLLGVDHDHFLTNQYQYAFPLTVLHGKDSAVGPAGEILISRHDDFQSLARLWRQYRCLREIAQASSISISNASPTGALDEFPRMDLKSFLLDIQS